MSGVWYCCDCSAGPHRLGLDDICLQCDQPRCSNCHIDTQDTVSHHCHELSPYAHAPAPQHSQVSGNPVAKMPTFLGCNQPILRGSLHHSHTLQHGMPGINNQDSRGTVSHGSLYFCCQCGDGPKLWDNQPRCVICDHNICGYCKPAK